MMKILLYGNFYEGNVAQEFSVFFKRKKVKIYKFNRSKFFNIFKNKYLNKLFNLLFQKIAEFAFFAIASSLVRIIPPLGPRKVLWVVLVAACTWGKGDG